MKHLIIFENFGGVLTTEYLEENYPISFDDSYEKIIGSKRWFIMIDDKPYYFSPDDGFNRIKTVLVNELKNKGIVVDDRNDVPIIKQYLKSRFT